MKAPILSILFFSTAGWAAVPQAQLNQKLTQVRAQRIAVERALLEAEQVKKSTEEQLKRLKTLHQLQNREKTLTEQRMRALEKYLSDLQERKNEVGGRLEESRSAVRRRLAGLIHPLVVRSDELIRDDPGAGERLIRARIVSGVAGLDLKEMESLRIDLQDAEDIESRIEQEKQQIASLLQDVSEQESLIEFHRKMKEEQGMERHEENVRRLEEYQQLKSSEVEIEKRIADFEGRQKVEEERSTLRKQPLVTLKPKALPWPLQGKLVQTYGQHQDSKTGLNIFSKGIEIMTLADHAPVQCVMDGRVQYSGEIPGKGKVLIVEHPHSIYTIYGGLQELSKGTGEEVHTADQLGFLQSERPLYFEIRSRNVAIDPVKWLQ